MQSLAKSLGSLHIDAGAKAGRLFKGQMGKQNFREGGGYHLSPFFWRFFVGVESEKNGTNTSDWHKYTSIQSDDLITGWCHITSKLITGWCHEMSYQMWWTEWLIDWRLSMIVRVIPNRFWEFSAKVVVITFNYPPVKTNMTKENPPWMKMYFLLKRGNFRCHVSFQGGIPCAGKWKVFVGYVSLPSQKLWVKFDVHFWPFPFGWRWKESVCMFDFGFALFFHSTVWSIFHGMFRNTCHCLPAQNISRCFPQWSATVQHWVAARRAAVGTPQCTCCRMSATGKTRSRFSYIAIDRIRKKRSGAAGNDVWISWDAVRMWIWYPCYSRAHVIHHYRLWMNRMNDACQRQTLIQTVWAVFE